MKKRNDDEPFWTKYKRFASTEIIMYLIMVTGIGIGIVIILMTT